MKDITPPKINQASYKHDQNQTRHKRWPFVALVVFLAIALSGATILWLYASYPKPVTPTSQTPMQTSETAVDEEPVESFDAKKLQQALDTWVKTQSSTASVVITDGQGEVLAQHQADRQYFAASIYKLYVAYEGYRAIDNGTHKLSESYLNGWTRAKCLDEMIRTSHSPCAEKLWVELGKENLNQTLQEYGIKNTSMTGITTTATDAAIMLARINQGQGLSKESKQALVDSMLNQVYRDALPKGFAGQKVYDKVGFREQVEYHDVGIVKFSDDRTLIVSVLSENVGTKNITALAEAIKEAVN